MNNHNPKSCTVCLLWLAVSTLCLNSSPAWAVPPTATYLFPAGARLGSTVTVTVGGSFERWPVQVWVNGKGVEAKAAKDKGKLTVTVSPDAIPGPYWFRFYDEQGASAPRTFLIGTLPEVVEHEPNDDLATAQKLESSNVVVNGRLARTGD